MAGNDLVAVTPGHLVSHATHLESVASEVAAAKQAGDTVRMGAGAYGQLCTIVPVMLGGLQDLLVDGLDAAVHSLQDTGHRLRTTAENYQSADESSGTTFDGLRG